MTGIHLAQTVFSSSRAVIHTTTTTVVVVVVVHAVVFRIHHETDSMRASDRFVRVVQKHRDRARASHRARARQASSGVVM